MKLCLVASSGGHLMQLVRLRSAWEGHERFWVTFKKEDAKTLLEGERVVWAYHPTNRHAPNLLRNLVLAWRILRKEKPDAVISTGAGVGVPFLWLGRLLGIRTVFIDSLTRIQDLSLSGKLVYPVVDRFFVQWPELSLRYRRGVFGGRVL